MGLSQFTTIYRGRAGRVGGPGRRVDVRCACAKVARQDYLVNGLCLIGTRAPAEVASWWASLLDGGSGPGTHVTIMAAPRRCTVG